MKIKAIAFLILALLVTPAHGAEELKVDISVSKNEFSVAEQIKFLLTIKNISNKPIRLMKPEVFKSNWDPRNTVEFIIVDSEGRNFRKTPHVGTGGILEAPSESYSLLLEPREISKTVHSLYPEGEFGEWSFQYPSNTYYETPWEETDSLEFLPAGKYRVSLKYYFPKKTMTPRWSNELSVRYGEPWHGELLSNEVEISIRPVTKEFIAQEFSKIIYSDGIDKKEAIILAQKYIIDKGLDKDYDVSGIAIAGTIDKNVWEVWFRTQPTTKTGEKIIAIDKITGEVKDKGTKW